MIKVAEYALLTNYFLLTRLSVFNLTDNCLFEEFDVENKQTLAYIKLKSVNLHNYDTHANKLEQKQEQILD